uniref:Uncharacterized protein n=1 Tax=Arundo donax TaxID=35708 RepID=A0A0A9HAZ5_ARUDO
MNTKIIKHSIQLNYIREKTAYRNIPKAESSLQVLLIMK